MNKALYLFMSKLMSMVNKDKVFMSPIKQEYNSSVGRHMLTNQKVWVSILSQGMSFLFCCVLIYMSFTQNLQGKTQVKNTGDTQEM